jgi:hypothetical protein
MIEKVYQNGYSEDWDDGLQIHGKLSYMNKLMRLQSSRPISVLTIDWLVIVFNTHPNIFFVGRLNYDIQLHEFIDSN